MTDVISDEKAIVDLDAAQPRPMPDVASDELVRQLAERARAEGLRLTAEGGLPSQLTKVKYSGSPWPFSGQSTRPVAAVRCRAYG